MVLGLSRLATIAAASLMSVPFAATAQEAPEPIDVSSDRYAVVIGTVTDEFGFTGQCQVDLIAMCEATLQVRLSDSETSRSLGIDHVFIPYWVESERDPPLKFGHEVLLVLDREEPSRVVQFHFAERFFCMDDDDFWAQDWDAMGDYRGDGCFQFDKE